MSATAEIREQWRALRRAPPGRRFQDSYERARETSRRVGAVARVTKIAVAIVALAIALVLSIFPGPAIPFFLIAGGLLALESRTIAKAMDWAEVQGRKIWIWLRRVWRRMPAFARVFTLAVGSCASATAAYVAYRLFRG